MSPQFRLGTPTVINVPRRGDVDGDGDVDVSIDLELVAEFTNEFGHVERAGYAITGGFGHARVTSVAGDVLLNRRYGPVFDQLCAPRVGGQEIPITCFTSGDTETFDYAPTGFGRPALIGALDLVLRIGSSFRVLASDVGQHPAESLDQSDDQLGSGRA